MNEDIKNVVTNALEEVFEELKDNALVFVENTVVNCKLNLNNHNQETHSLA